MTTLHMLVPCDCSNKSTPAWWFTTTHIYSLVVMEVKSQKKPEAARTEVLQIPEAKLFLAFQSLLVDSSPWIAAASL